MRTNCADLISVIEACYHLHLTETAWLHQIVDRIQPVFSASRGVLGFLLSGPAGGPNPPAIRAAVAEGPLNDLSFLGTLIEKVNRPELIERFVLMGASGTLRRTLQSWFSAPDGFQCVLQPYGIEDAAYLLAGDTAGVSCVVAIASGEALTVESRQSDALACVAAHIAGADRLRRARASPNLSTDPTVEAILAPNGAMIHATGPAIRNLSQSALKEAAQLTELAMGALRRDDPIRAVSVWHSLISGRWTLFEQFDTDGKRYFVARRNEPAAIPHSQLSPREAQVASLAALGHSNKVIAYELGISLSTVATCLGKALTKLGIGSRLDLIRLFLTTLPKQ